MGSKNEGTMIFWLNHEHKDWSTNSSGYNFDIIEQKDFSAEVRKHPDKTIEIKLTGLFDKTFVFKNPIPQCDQRGLQVAVTWKNTKVELYLNGKSVDSKPVEEAE